MNSFSEIAVLCGKTVAFATEGYSTSENPFVTLTFTDGTILTVCETGQMGSIAVEIELPPERTV